MSHQRQSLILPPHGQRATSAQTLHCSAKALSPQEGSAGWHGRVRSRTRLRLPTLQWRVQPIQQSPQPPSSCMQTPDCPNDKTLQETTAPSTPALSNMRRFPHLRRRVSNQIKCSSRISFARVVRSRPPGHRFRRHSHPYQQRHTIWLLKWHRRTS